MKMIFFIFVSLLIIQSTYGQDSRTQRVAEATHSLFTEILSQYVHDDKVNYADLQNDARLERYANRLSQTNPDTIKNQKDKLAFWINAYNAFTLKVICDNYPVESINDLHFGGLIVGSVLNKTVWDEKFIEINGTEMSLNHIEHEIIRKEFDDPRTHFALVCAAVSCPPLRSEAYEGYKLAEQLNEQGRIFLSQEDKNYFNLEKQEAHLSKIMDWYEKDFGATDEEVLLYLARFVPEQTASAIKQNPGEWKIKHTDYDWSLNE